MSPQQLPSDDASRPSPPGELSAAQRMLLDVRDTLYEGRWDDFAADLEARLRGEAHVFDVVPDTPRFAETIRSHLRMIDELRAWEQESGQTLHSHSED